MCHGLTHVCIRFVKNLTCIFHGIAKAPKSDDRKYRNEKRLRKYDMIKWKWTRFKKAVNSLKMTSNSKREKLLGNENLTRQLLELFLKTDDNNFWDSYIKLHNDRFYNVFNEDFNPLLDAHSNDSGLDFEKFWLQNYSPKISVMDHIGVKYISILIDFDLKTKLS